MEGIDLQVLRTAVDWLDAGRRVTLATVVQTWGSSPRPPGAWAVFRDDGAVVGSVSGGCVEADLVDRVRVAGPSARLPELVSYGVTPEEAARFGLPCGGRLAVVVEPAADTAVLRDLAARLQRRETVMRRLDLGTGRTELAPAERGDGLRYDGVRLETVHGPCWRLLIIGAGQVSQFLAGMAQALDYEVIICDPRQEYRDAWNVDGARLANGMPDDLVVELGGDARTAVVALTHDPKLDDLALIEALRSPAFYVGALGSKASNARRRDRLGEHFGLAATELARLHGPVGLPIGSRTPPEIAVSILAEMTAVKNSLAADRMVVPQPAACVST